MNYGYLRVSSLRQNIANQKGKIKNTYEIDEWVKDIGTGWIIQPNLKALIRKSKKGDTIITTALDRLVRNVKAGTGILDTLERKGVRLISMRDNIDFFTSTEKLLFNNRMSMAEFERNVIRDRVKDGLNRVRSQGVSLGPPKKLEPSQELKIVECYSYLKNRYNTSLREAKMILGYHFGKKMSYGYLHGIIKKHAIECWDANDCPEAEKLDKLRNSLKSRHDEIESLNQQIIKMKEKVDNINRAILG